MTSDSITTPLADAAWRLPYHFAKSKGVIAAGMVDEKMEIWVRPGVQAATLAEVRRIVGVPLTAITNATYSDARQRQLFKNIIYVGALAEILGMEAAAVEGLIAEQFKGKEKLIPANLEALHLGRDRARAEIGPIALKVRRADAVGDRIFLERVGGPAAAVRARC